MPAPRWDRCSSSSWPRAQDASSNVVQYFNAWKLFPLEKLEGRSTASRNVAHLFLEPGFGNGSGGIATAHYRRRAFGGRVSHRVGDRASTAIERRCFKDSHRSVPDHRLSRSDRARVRSSRLRTDVEHRLILWYGVSRNDLRGLRLIERRSNHRIVRQRELHPATREQILRHGYAVLLDERFAGLESHRLVECARHRSTNQQTIDLWKELLDHVYLAGNLGATENRDEGELGI